eukprot:c25968_g1_i1 orf=317-499(-)
MGTTRLTIRSRTYQKIHDICFKDKTQSTEWKNKAPVRKSRKYRQRNYISSEVRLNPVTDL